MLLSAVNWDTVAYLRKTRTVDAVSIVAGERTFTIQRSHSLIECDRMRLPDALLTRKWMHC